MSYDSLEESWTSLINLPKMVQDEMDTYYDYMKTILPSMGYSVLHASKSKKEELKQEVYSLHVEPIKATARLTPNGIEVQPGSEMAKKQVASFSGSNSYLRLKLMEKGLVKEQEKVFIFTQPYEFSSPSTAAAGITSYSINGRAAWKNKLGKSLKEIEEEKMLL